MNERAAKEVLVVRRSSLLAKRGAVISCALALVLDLICLGMGLSDDRFGWAFKMPSIFFSALVALTAGAAAVILGILRLMHTRGKEVLTWIVVILAAVAGLAGALMALLSVAASASV